MWRTKKWQLERRGGESGGDVGLAGVREKISTLNEIVCVCVGTLNSHSNISISGHTFYRLMIENGVIKLKDRNGSAQGEIEITTIFIPCVIFLFVVVVVVVLVVLFCRFV